MIGVTSNARKLPRSDRLAESEGTSIRGICLHSKIPKDEMYGLTSQMRRAAVSVPSNIAEGYGRVTTGEFKQFLRWKPNIGSSQELQDDAMPTLHDWTLQPSRRQLPPNRCCRSSPRG